MEEVSQNAQVVDNVLKLDTAKLKTKAKKQRKHGAAGKAEDTVNAGMDKIYKSLTVLADKVLNKLDELLKNDLPEGVRSLNPEDHTPEKTAERIVSGVVGLFGVYARQNPELEGEELIDSFMAEVKKGIQTGYEDAVGILDGLGAFEFDGVKSGIEETMRLVDEKLNAFSNQLKEQFGLKDSPDADKAAAE